MGQYSKNGSYAGYKKNHKERQAEDYYATPTDEVTNILEVEGLDIYTVEGIKTHYTVLEPCVGGGHMLQGIINYAEEKGKFLDITIRDIKDRNPQWEIHTPHNVIIDEQTFGQDFLADDYPTEKFDFVIMNPPFVTAEPFVLRALELTKHKLIMFEKTKFIEGVSRHKNIFTEYPPQRMYQYIERVACAKDGNFNEKQNAIEASAWFVWDLDDPNFGKNKITELHWIHRRK